MGNGNWETPDWFVERGGEYTGCQFDIDLAATRRNKKAESWIGPGSPICEDLFGAKPELFKECSWGWLNPPYKNLSRWMGWAMLISDCGLGITALLPIPRGDSWFAPLRQRAEIVWVDGRIKFIDPDKKGRTSPSGGNILAVFRPPTDGIQWPVGFTGAVISGKE